MVGYSSTAPANTAPTTDTRRSACVKPPRAPLVVVVAVKLTGAGAVFNDMLVLFETKVGPVPPPVPDVLGAR